MRHCCQAGQNSSEFKVQHHRFCEVSAWEGGCSALVFSSAVLFSWYPSLHVWVPLLTSSLLPSISAVFLTPFFTASAVSLFPLSSCHLSLPSLPASWHRSLPGSRQEQPRPLPGSRAILLLIRSAPQTTSFRSHSTNLYPATILTIL